ncbi:MAG: amidohydrolase [Planctomycetes bacterium]|nr:amidohydrolase [Planctomycetota bacterium]
MRCFAAVVGCCLLSPLAAQGPDASWFEREAPALEALYRDLHTQPELSFRETQTAARLAVELRQRGLEVTTGVGGTGLVAVQRGGDGAVVLLRADMDALPVAEETGLPYASTIHAASGDGRSIGVMHACGHDLHMACLVGAAAFLQQHPELVRGTVVFQLQPAEERAGGMKAMLADGLLTRFPRPDRAIALHVASDLPTGVVGVRSGYAMANVDSCDITVFGRGGHGAAPHLTSDPIVAAAMLVLELQTIVSREIDPIEPCVITVGSIQGGNKHNIIPDECHLQVTVRSYSPAVRERLLAAIRRKAKAVAMSCGALEPKVEFSEPTPALRNDAALTELVRFALVGALGADRVVEVPPAMVAEDFGRLDAERVPLCMFRLGTIAPERLSAMQAAGDVPALHSGRYYPDYAPALRTGVQALVAATLAAMAKAPR